MVESSPAGVVPPPTAGVVAVVYVIVVVRPFGKPATGGVVAEVWLPAAL